MPSSSFSEKEIGSFDQDRGFSTASTEVLGRFSPLLSRRVGVSTLSVMPPMIMSISWERSRSRS